jgi:CBS domain containing-hemolysin-like protein
VKAFAHTSRAMRRLLACWVVALVPAPAWGSFLSGEALDTMADILAIVVLVIVPAGAIVLFWIVHVLPEKIAHKRHHPQTAAITTLCLLSLVFGGLLWPLAWIWAYTKPIGYRLAYGTDKHDDYYDEMADKHREGGLLAEEVTHLREELEAMEARGALPPRLRSLKENLADAKLRAPAKAKDKAA